MQNVKSRLIIWYTKSEEKIEHKANQFLGEIKELKAELKYKPKSDEDWDVVKINC